MTKKKSRKKKVYRSGIYLDGHKDPFDDLSGVNSVVRGDYHPGDAVSAIDAEMHAHMKAHADHLNDKLHYPANDDPDGLPGFLLGIDAQTKALKHDSGKPRMDLVSPGALLELGKVLAYGANKYGDQNWRNNGGLDWSRPLAAAYRHLLAWQGGQDLDDESGLLHLAHAMCNLMMLLDYGLTGNGSDNRYRVELRKP